MAEFQLGEPKSPEVSIAKEEQEERGSMYSSCGSISFVITDDADIEKLPEPAPSPPPPAADNVMTSYMTQSQYAQVRFSFY